MISATKNSRVEKRSSGRACRHCGVPTAGPEEEFCCTGCAYVFRLIHEEGLSAYYQIKDKVTSPADAALLPSRDYVWLTEAQAKAEGAAGERTPELRLDVQGISCAGCVWLIERVFSKQTGSGRVEVNAQTGQMRITWQAGRFDAAAFGKTLQTFNYLVSPATAARSAPPESRALVKRIGLCAAFAMNVMLYTLPSYFGMEAGAEYARLFSTLSMAFATLSLLAGGGYFIGRAVRCLREGVPNIDIPIALGIVGAFTGSFFGWLSGHDTFLYFDFVSTFILLMLIGRWAQLAAVERNQRRLLAQQPTPPRVRAWTREGVATDCAPDEIVRGMKFAVAPGQTVPVEGRLTTADVSMSLAWINGESAPRVFRAGQRIASGAINLTRSDAIFEATQDWKDSLLAELTKPVERGAYRYRFIERVITGYLIGILSIATLAGLGWWLATHDAVRSCSVVTAILVVSCPCAIGLSFPLADEMATVALRKRGVFVRAGDLWPRLARVRKLIFDKTGTLTLETPTLRGGSRLEQLPVLERRALLALVQDNQHPVARCLHEQLLAQGELEPLAGEVVETVGQGVAVLDGGVEWRLGRAVWAQCVGRPDGDASPGSDEATETVLTRAGAPVAAFQFAESARSDAVEEIARLRQRRLNVVVLSGDRRHKVDALVEQLGLPTDSGVGEMTPREKAAWLETNGSGDALMLGDGANDSLAFDQALCRGTPVVHRGVLAEKADFYYLGRGIAGIRALFEVNDARRRTHAWLLVFSISYNALAVSLSVLGHMNPLLAAILMPLSSLISVAIVGAGMRPAWRETERR